MINTTTNNKILVVYNTCGLSGKENSEYYIKSITNLLQQDFNGFKIVVSSCCNSYSNREKLQNEFNDRISYNFIDDIHPVNVTFNHTIKNCVKQFGGYEGYLYVDSGTDVKNQIDVLSKLYNRLKTGKYGMVTAQPSTDTEYYAGLGIGRYRGDDEYAKQIIFKNGDYIIPLGKGVGTHLNLISNKIYEYYGNAIPDIFASHCTESTFSFLNAALKLQWVLVNDVEVYQEVSLDGQSSGFNTMVWVNKGNQTYEHPYKVHSILERLDTDYARSIGMGYEECRQISMHNQKEFDANYHCTNNVLKEFIKDKLYLKQYEFDYDTVKTTFIT